MRSQTALVVALLLSTASAYRSEAATGEPSKPTLAVMDLEAKGATPLEAEAVTAGVVRGIRELDVFNVLAAEDVRQLLAIERTKVLLGTADASTPGAQPLPLSDALGARNAVVGSVRGTKDAITAELRLLDTTTQKVLAQKTVGPAPLASIARDVVAVSQELVGPLLQEQQGNLVVRTSEEGAEIRVDDVLRGSSPMKDPVALPRGAHRLELRKDGFIAALEPVRIEPNQTAVEEVKLIPSADYAEAWKLRHGRLRIGAWISTVVAVGAIGGAVFLDRSAEAVYQQQFLPRKYALDGVGAENLGDAQQQATYSGCLSAQRELCSEQTRGYASQIAAQQYGTIGLAALGVAATGVATYLWLSGEDPNRYSKLVAGVSVGPAPGLVLAGAF